MSFFADVQIETFFPSLFATTLYDLFCAIPGPAHLVAFPLCLCLDLGTYFCIKYTYQRFFWEIMQLRKKLWFSSTNCREKDWKDGDIKNYFRCYQIEYWENAVDFYQMLQIFRVWLNNFSTCTIYDCVQYKTS